MSDEARLWLRYAQENLEMARMALERRLYNPCLHNAQQAVEKALKSALLACGLVPAKTHSIQKLKEDLLGAGVDVGLADDDCDLLDSVYLPSKYPLGSALPDFDPDEKISRECLMLAERIIRVITRTFDME